MKLTFFATSEISVKKFGTQLRIDRHSLPEKKTHFVSIALSVFSGIKQQQYQTVKIALFWALGNTNGSCLIRDSFDGIFISPVLVNFEFVEASASAKKFE